MCGSCRREQNVKITFLIRMVNHHILYTLCLHILPLLHTVKSHEWTKDMQCLATYKMTPVGIMSAFVQLQGESKTSVAV
jgi:hypothetical protein